MLAIEGFAATWAKARDTFGEGVPDDGAQFDQSASFQRLHTNVESAAPGATWSGSGSETYAAANAVHARTFEGLASADRRLATEVGNSATVVAAGRRDLATVRKWVADAAAQLPGNAAGERTLWQVVGKGSGEIADVITRSHGDLSAIAARIRTLGDEYERLGTPEGDGVQMVDFQGGGGEGDHDVPKTALDLKDIVQLNPFDPADKTTFPPPGYMELVPKSGTWVPDPRSPYYRPTPVEAPLDLTKIVQRKPFDRNDPTNPAGLGPYGYIELVPDSGTWVPDPNGMPYQPQYPDAEPARPVAPLDLNDIVDRGTVDANGNRILGLPWEMELVPHSGVWVPDPTYGRPH